MTTPDPTSARYQDRLQRVLAHIEAHLDDDLGVAQLSRVAAFSPHHFHRQFSAFYGLGVHAYVQLCRLKRASFELAFRSDRPVIEIALAAGYERPESFSRAFRQRIGQSPTAFRQQPDWDAWHAAYQPVNQLRSHHMTATPSAAAVAIVEVEDTPVALLEHRGDPQRIGDTIRRFIAWRKRHRLHPSVSATYNLLHNDPTQVAPADYRLDLCAAFRGEVAPNDEGVVASTIPAGRCARLRHIGSDDTLGQTILALYADWLPHSGEELRDFPVYLQRVRFFPDVPEAEAVTEVFLPLK